MLIGIRNCAAGDVIGGPVNNAVDKDIAFTGFLTVDFNVDVQQLAVSGLTP